MKKKLFIVLGVLLVLGLFFTACSSGGDDGDSNVFANTSWRYSGPINVGGGQTISATINLSFKTDTWTMLQEAMGQSETYTGTYTADGNTAILSMAGESETIEVIRSGNTLTLPLGNESGAPSVVLTKQ
jgi:hypothetical protein